MLHLKKDLHMLNISNSNGKLLSHLTNLTDFI